MAVRNKGQKKAYVDEIKLDGAAVQKELDDGMTNHLAEYTHSGSTVSLLVTTVENEIIKSVMMEMNRENTI